MVGSPEAFLFEDFLFEDGQAHFEDRDAVRGDALERSPVGVSVEGYHCAAVVQGHRQAVRAEEGVYLGRLLLDGGIARSCGL